MQDSVRTSTKIFEDVRRISEAIIYGTRLLMPTIYVSNRPREHYGIYMYAETYTHEVMLYRAYAGAYAIEFVVGSALNCTKHSKSSSRTVIASVHPISFHTSGGQKSSSVELREVISAAASSIVLSV